MGGGRDLGADESPVVLEFLAWLSVLKLGDGCDCEAEVSTRKYSGELNLSEAVLRASDEGRLIGFLCLDDSVPGVRRRKDFGSSVCWVEVTGSAPAAPRPAATAVVK